MARATRFPALERRLQAKYGGRVWLEKSDLPGLPYDAQPWAFFGRDKRGAPYKILDCIGEDGSYREPGEWALRTLDWLRNEVQWGTTRGTHMRIEEHVKEQERLRKRHWSRRVDETFDEIGSKLKHHVGWKGMNVGHWKDGA